MLIKNTLISPSKHMCFYVNTNLPKDYTPVEAYPCIKAISAANNSELFVFYNDRSIRHFNSALCLGFNSANEIVLRKCSQFNPSFIIYLRKDGSMYFRDYQDQSIFIDDTSAQSPNYITDQTPILVTSSADQQSYKKENIKSNLKF